MKLYLSKDGRFEAPGKQSKGSEKIDVPTDTAGLCDYLNELTANVPPQDALEVEQPPEPVVARAPVTIEKPTPQSSWTASEIADFILNTASVNQAANILSCLGTRFGELAGEKRA